MSEENRSIMNITEAPITFNAPPYNPNNLNTWFLQMQALFNSKGITSQRTKYAFLVEKLPGEVANEVTDLLDPMPEDRPYDILKAAILKRTGKSDESKLRDLFNNIELGHRTPSQLLRQMKMLLGDNEMSTYVLRRLWLDKLPQNITQILAPMNEETPLDQLAEFADRIHVVDYRQPNTNAITQPSQTQNQQIQQLQATVASLAAQMQTLMSIQQNQDRQGRSWDRRKFDRKRSRSRSKSRHKTCYYHYKFGKDARKCILPCSFKDSENFQPNQ